MFIRIDQMRVHVVFDDLGHETRHGAARARYEVHDLLARRLSLKSTSMPSTCPRSRRTRASNFF